MTAPGAPKGRFLPMAGGFNFRDLGGYAGADGRRILWRRLIRSDDLSELTGPDLAYLAALPVATIVDFRSPGEIRAAPDRVPASLRQHLECSICPGNLAESLETSHSVTSGDVDRIMEHINELLVSDAAAIAQYRRLFGLLQEAPATTPLLYRMFRSSGGSDSMKPLCHKGFHAF